GRGVGTGVERGVVESRGGTRHGGGRPFVPVIKEPPSEQVSLRWDGHVLWASADHRLWRLDARWADRFWRLVRREGSWGLAYLEALLRLADAARSAEEQQLGGGTHG